MSFKHQNYRPVENNSLVWFLTLIGSKNKLVLQWIFRITSGIGMKINITVAI